MTPGAKMWRSIVRLLFPVECAGCGEEGEWLCASCYRQLRQTPAERCRICGKGQFQGSGLCLSCQQVTGLDGVVALFDYQDSAVAELIRQAKYHQQADALRFLTDKMRLRLLRQLPEFAWQFSYAPLDSGRLAKRGFNQAELIARAVAGQDYSVTNLFGKIGVTLPQAKLNGRERRANLRRAFSLRQTPPPLLVVCDDVITTGTTLSRLAKLAKKRGAEQVWALTIAHG